VKNFKNKVVVITGAGSGIGRSTAIAFAKEGAVLHITDIKKDRIESVANEIRTLGAKATPYVTDSSNRKAMQKLADDVFKSSGRVDILHNNAGISIGCHINKLSLEDWENIININLWGTIYGIHFFLPRMIEQGTEAHIINTASGAGLAPLASLAAYSATKAAIVTISEVMNIELQKYKIYTTALCPGIVNTNLVSETKIELTDKQEKNIKEEIVEFYKKYGVSPDKVAKDVLKAVKRHTPEKPSPGSHVYPLWILKRISTRLYQSLMRVVSKIAGL
jgi:NADP-dependent 3-hydroxy acid dehydrogenase YdfG